MSGTATAMTSGQSGSAATSAIAVHPAFKKHHRPSARLSHFDGSPSELIVRVKEALGSQKPAQKVGKLPGSLIVEIDPTGVYCKVDEGARTRDGYEKPEARRAEVVLHHKEIVMPVGGKYRGRLHRLLRQDVQYFVVAVHGWLSPGHQPGGHT